MAAPQSLQKRPAFIRKGHFLPHVQKPSLALPTDFLGQALLHSLLQGWEWERTSTWREPGAREVM